MASPLLSELAFGAFLVYSPRGTSEVSQRSRLLRNAVKRGDPAALERIVERLRSDFASTGLDALLGPDVALVPTPRSAPLLEGALWPGLRITEMLVSAGFGAEVVPFLQRIEAVPKSAFQAPGERPSALRHYETMRVEAELLAPSRITLIDDFVTKGNTLLGAASRLAEAFPEADVRAFAVVRTLGLQPDVERVVEPCVGTIRSVSNEARREP